MKIHEVLEYGPIVANDGDFDVLITVNGSYFNVWCGNFDGGYTNTDCYALSSENGLYGMDMVKIMDRAKELLTEITNEVE